MMEEGCFRNLICGVRAQDQAAAAALVRRYEPEIRKTIRLALINFQMAHVLDAADICQAVFAAFFLRVAKGHFELHEPEHLIKLLATMARNRVLDELRKHRATRRDNGFLGQTSMDSCLDEAIDSSPTPSKVVAGRELVQELYRRLSEKDRYLAEQRSLGYTWEMIGARLGAKPSTLRKRLKRSMKRAMDQLGLGAMALS